MSDASKQQGAEDARQGKGQVNPNSFSHAKDREDYQAAYEHAKKNGK